VPATPGLCGSSGFLVGKGLAGENEVGGWVNMVVGQRQPGTFTFSLEFRMCVLVSKRAGEGLAWCVLSGAVPGEGTAELLL